MKSGPPEVRAPCEKDALWAAAKLDIARVAILGTAPHSDADHAVLHHASTVGKPDRV